MRKFLALMSLFLNFTANATEQKIALLDDLSADIKNHHVLPSLEDNDLLSLRVSSKATATLVENFYKEKFQNPPFKIPFYYTLPLLLPDQPYPCKPSFKLINKEKSEHPYSYTMSYHIAYLEHKKSQKLISNIFKTFCKEWGYTSRVIILSPIKEKIKTHKLPDVITGSSISLEYRYYEKN